MTVGNATLPFALLGVLFGIIFVSDGWLSYEGSSRSLAMSPKVRGLIYILGGGVIPSIKELTPNPGPEQTNTLSIYTLFVSISILTALFFLTLYAFLISFHRLRKISTNESFLGTAIEALPFVSIAIQEGNQKFKEALDTRLTLKASEQRDKAIEFLGTAYNDLIQYCIRGIEGCDELDEFIKFHLGNFVRDFLDNSKDSYRACVYYFDKNSNDMLFFTGISPQTAPHTRDRLPARNSLAGYAIEHPYIAHLHIVSQKKSNRSMPFHSRNNPGRYKSVVVCAIKHPKITNDSFPKMALCIDCIYGKANAFGDFEYIAKIIVLLSIILANAQILMKVDNEGIKNYIQNLS